MNVNQIKEFTESANLEFGGEIEILSMEVQQAFPGCTWVKVSCNGENYLCDVCFGEYGLDWIY